MKMHEEILLEFDPEVDVWDIKEEKTNKILPAVTVNFYRKDTKTPIKKPF